ncbi:hypothetical protein MWU75_10285 [Ornithinimicrobium sp. F0845]|uniref:hypothetical protein n=1 Tax=Ornithinimicrobium sp. F0845 TaxID=2926412 RepID=UPI001FF27553|nr:hypothetical protein [Ornithinimicrobium sp. F0845]MCK0112526.1 hypothetical protein [Ornithinimicrobium sp. F0845]
MRRSPLIVLGTTVAVLTLGACSSGGDEFCTTLTDSSATAATAFAPLIPGMNTGADAQERLDLLTAAESHVPEDLEGDFFTWKGYLQTAVETIDSDPSAVLAKGSASDVAAAGEALSDYYTGTCMN